MILLPKNVVLLFCAVSNVSCSVNGSADDGHRAGSGLLRAANGTMEVIHTGAGDPGSDLKLVAVLPNTGIAASLERAVLPSGEPLTAVQASHCETRMQLGAEDHLHEGWWGLGQMAGPITFRGSTTSTRWRRYQCTAGEGRHRGAQAEK